MSSTYSRFRLLGRDLLAVPSSGAKIRRNAWATLPGRTWRARLVKGLVAGALSIHADRLLGDVQASPLDGLAAEDWRALLSSLANVLSAGTTDAVVVHAGPSRQSRYYVHLFDDSGARIGFAKVSRTPKGENPFAAEKLALQEVGRRDPRSFRVPSVRASGREGDLEWLLLDPLPLSAEPYAPRWTSALAAIHEEIAGPQRALPSLTAYSWWPRFAELAGSLPTLTRRLLAEERSDLRCVAAHGDFVNWNLHSANGVIWVIDWESFSPDAPFLSDPLRFFLGARTRKVTQAPARVVTEMFERFCGDQGHPERAVLRALAFLHSREVDTATRVALTWEARQRGIG